MTRCVNPAAKIVQNTDKDTIIDNPQTNAKETLWYADGRGTRKQIARNGEYERRRIKSRNLPRKQKVSNTQNISNARLGRWPHTGRVERGIQKKSKIQI
jgi:hypothetical protein